MREVIRARAVLGSLVFLCLAPGTVAGLIPRWITGWRWPLTSSWWAAAQVAGALVAVVAATALVAEFGRFAMRGLGTPAPIAPTRRLVDGGLYRWVRNPMYLCVIAIILGQALLFASPALLLYAAATAAVMVAFVRWWEEPRLARRFGADYAAYRERVPGWFPRRRGARRPGS